LISSAAAIGEPTQRLVSLTNYLVEKCAQMAAGAFDGMVTFKSHPRPPAAKHRSKKIYFMALPVPSASTEPNSANCIATVSQSSRIIANKGEAAHIRTSNSDFVDRLLQVVTKFILRNLWV
jgi:hypothetical protein